MPGQPPQAYLDAYWGDVTEELRTTHLAQPNEVQPAIDAYRNHMAPAGQTLYNRSPESVARSIVAHGLLASVPPVGACLQLTFILSDPNRVLDDPQAVALKVQGLLDALSDYERLIGGAGLMRDGMESAPGIVQLYLKPAEVSGAMSRLKQVADAVNNPTPAAWQVSQQRNLPISDMRFPIAAVAVKQAA